MNKLAAAALGGTTVAASFMTWALLTPSPAPRDVASPLTAVPQECAAWRAEHAGLPTGEDLDTLRVCNSYSLGESTRSLRAVAVQWDATCLSGLGWGFDAATNTPTPPESYLQMEVGGCATPQPSAQECEQLRDGLAVRSQVYSARVAAVLIKVGCSETVQKDIAAARTGDI